MTEEKRAKFSAAKALADRIFVVKASWCPRCEIPVLLANDLASCAICGTEVGVVFQEFTPAAIA